MHTSLASLQYLHTHTSIHRHRMESCTWLTQSGCLTCLVPIVPHHPMLCLNLNTRLSCLSSLPNPSPSTQAKNDQQDCQQQADASTLYQHRHVMSVRSEVSGRSGRMVGQPNPDWMG